MINLYYELKNDSSIIPKIIYNNNTYFDKKLINNFNNVEELFR